MKATRLSETWETIGRELKMKQNKTKQIWDKIFIKSVTLWKPNVTLKLDANPQWSKLLPLLFLIHWLIMELIINVIENHCWILWRLLPNNILWKNVKKKKEFLRETSNNVLNIQNQQSWCSIYLKKFMVIINIILTQESTVISHF